MASAPTRTMSRSSGSTCFIICSDDRHSTVSKLLSPKMARPFSMSCWITFTPRWVLASTLSSAISMP